ncbi:hypothetical protein BV25DRAFT_1818366 [Artomyces pyxidatus]|uniref:Uncharacterized protein n=1 Tax=Artomyces pyxidatus TaxID=48021 RepID=A0ACB8THU2_9AGAM|nr:hypothetical protein BV25DRAFT_1818366 [Artomyces pyxidatus]
MSEAPFVVFPVPAAVGQGQLSPRGSQPTKECQSAIARWGRANVRTSRTRCLTHLGVFISEMREPRHPSPRSPGRVMSEHRYVRYSWISEPVVRCRYDRSSLDLHRPP